RYVDVVGGVRAAHVERVLRALGPRHPEVRQEFLRQIQIRRAQPPIREVRHLDQCHGSLRRRWRFWPTRVARVTRSLATYRRALPSTSPSVAGRRGPARWPLT